MNLWKSLHIATRLVRNNATSILPLSVLIITLQACFLGSRASGGRVLRSELHGVGIGCYMKIPEEIEIYEDNQRNVMGGWEVNGVDERDQPSYEGVLTMHQHFVDSVRNRTVPLTDLRDVIHSIHLVDQIEGPLPD